MCWVEIECWGSSPDEIKEMAVREASKFFGDYSGKYDLVVGRATPRERDSHGAVLSWEADVRVMPRGQG